MKVPFWTDPNTNIKTIEATEEAAEKYGHNYGSDLVALSDEQIEALIDGKMLAWEDGEYSTFVVRANPCPPEMVKAHFTLPLTDKQEA